MPSASPYPSLLPRPLEIVTSGDTHALLGQGEPCPKPDRFSVLPQLFCPCSGPVSAHTGRRVQWEHPLASLSRSWLDSASLEQLQ